MRVIMLIMRLLHACHDAILMRLLYLCRHTTHSSVRSMVEDYSICVHILHIQLILHIQVILHILRVVEEGEAGIPVTFLLPWPSAPNSDVPHLYSV